MSARKNIFTWGGGGSLIVLQIAFSKNDRSLLILDFYRVQ